MKSSPEKTDILRIFIGGLVFLCLLFSGCGDNNLFEGLADDDSKEAQTEQALIAMDDGDYATAISILSSLVASYPDDDALAQYLSSAYSGSAGLDTFDLIEVINTLDDADNSGSIDMVGLVLGDENGLLTSEQVQDKLEDIETAMEVLNAIGTLNEDQRIQLGVLSVTHLSLTMADIILTDLADEGVDEVTLTEEGINTLYGPSSADFSDVDTDTLALEEIDEDLDNIETSIDDIQNITDMDNDLAQDFYVFLAEINPSGGDISVTDLQDYIDGL